MLSRSVLGIPTMGFLGGPRRPARPHLLLRAVRHRWRRGLHVQNGLAELHMTDIFLLRVKVDRVAEGGRSTYVQYIVTIDRCSLWPLGGAGRRFRPHNRFLPPNFTLRQT